MKILRSVFMVLFAFFTLVSSTNVQAFNIYRVGDEIAGKEYNDTAKKWLNKSFSVWVGIDEDKRELVCFVGNSISGVATVTVVNSEDVLTKLETAVSKAIEWSGIAQKNKADGSKGLGCFGDCSADGGNRMGWSFFSANGGKQTNLIIKMVDMDNQSITACLYVEPPEMAKLLVVVKGINEAMEKVRNDVFSNQ